VGTHLSLLLATCAWGGAFVAIKYLLGRPLDPLALTIGRFAVVGALLVIVLAAYGRRSPLPDRRDWPRIAIIGILGAPVYHLALNYGETRVSAAAAGILVSTSPVITAILSALFLRERFSRVKALGVVVAFAGVLLVILYGGGNGGGRISLWGFAVTMICPVSWAAYNVLSKPIASKLPSFHLTAYTGLIGIVVLMSLWSAPVTREIGSLDVWGWAVLVYLGAVCTVLGYVIWYRGLRILSATQVAVYVYLVPVFAMLLARVFLGETITPLLVIGAVLIISGIALANVARPRVLEIRR
jgi:drug/metabolite transporter (DMT)-like permease